MEAYTVKTNLHTNNKLTHTVIFNNWLNSVHICMLNFFSLLFLFFLQEAQLIGIGIIFKWKYVLFA